jgi:hypothetical protein
MLLFLAGKKHRCFGDARRAFSDNNHRPLVNTVRLHQCFFWRTETGLNESRSLLNVPNDPECSGFINIPALGNVKVSPVLSPVLQRQQHWF